MNSCLNRLATLFDASVGDLTTVIARSVRPEGSAVVVDVGGFTPATLRVILHPAKAVAVLSVVCLAGGVAANVSIPETYAGVPIFDVDAPASSSIDCTVFAAGFDGDVEALGIIAPSEPDRPEPTSTAAVPPVGNTLNLRVYECPLGYEGSNFEADCDGHPVDGLTIRALYLPAGGSYGEAVTGADGMATLDIQEWGDGRARVVVLDPSAISVDGAVRCTAELGDVAILDGPPGRDTPIFDLDMTGAVNVSCVLYLVRYGPSRQVPRGIDTTSPAVENLLSLRVYECPLGYDGDDFALDCGGHPVAGALVTATASVVDGGAFATTADADGVATIDVSDWQNGWAQLVVRDPAWLSYGGAAFCAAAAGEFAVREVPAHREGPAVHLWIDHPVNPTCDIYIVPFAERGDAVPAPAANETALVIHSRRCPGAYKDSNYYRDCHDRPVRANFFSLRGTAASTGFTEADGNVTFGALPPGAYTVVGGIPGDFGSLFVYCSINGDPSVRVPVTTRWIVGQGPGIAASDLTLPAGAAVVCDAYYLPI